ncbi:MAG: 1-phosphofructokinase family hexose kinase [bacterium]
MFVTLTLNPAVDQALQVAGELALNHLHLIEAETNSPGGKGVNVAKVLAANRRPVAAAGLLGEDQLGFYQKALIAAGITCCFLPLPHPTRINLMFSDGQGHEMKFNRPGFPDLAFDEAALLAYARSLATPGNVIIMSGSLPVQFPPTTYALLIRLFRSAGCPTVIDTSGPALAAALTETPDVIKPNRQELESVLGKSLETEAAMHAALRRLMSRHEVIIVSDGARGAWFADRTRIWFAAAPAVACVDTTGAGDSLLGQFCADYFPARQLTPELMARAVAAGAAAVERHGTPVIPPARIHELAQQVHPTLSVTDNPPPHPSL